jgi:hypothetical protein
VINPKWFVAYVAALFPAALAARPGTPLSLPIEVVGPGGTIRTVALDMPTGRSRDAQFFWMQIHGLGYDRMASVQVNDGNWFVLTDGSVAVAEPGRSYGEIGGGFSTLKMRLALPTSAVKEGLNTVRFRFNGTNGISSGFRVLAFNFLDSDDRPILPDTGFTQEDPTCWKSPLEDGADIAAGAKLWHNAQLRANSFADSAPIRAHCGDCHTSDGRDLKYFNYSNDSIMARAQFHGLSAIDGKQIASYIRSLPVPNPGRPWNPPYQPGPGLDKQPVENWAAGAGLASVLTEDEQALSFIFPGRISPAAFRPDGDLNVREIPIAMQLPDWNHWLPRIHPLDAWGSTFLLSRFSKLYRSDGDARALFDQWSKEQRVFLARREPRDTVEWSPSLMQKVYSSQLWQLVKTWEITQDLALESQEPQRTWSNNIPAVTAPASANIPDGPNGMGGSALTNEYYTSCWYELQLLLNNGAHKHRDTFPIDWPYFVESFGKLYQQSSKPEPGRLLVAIIKAMQSTDTRIGPGDLHQGWRPERNVDPRIMVDARWAPLFRPLTARQKQAITESFLSAWLDKNTQYRTGEYFRSGASAQYALHSYQVPDQLRPIYGGRAWEATRQFETSGIRAELVQRLSAWGRSYDDLAQLFHY